MRNTTRGGFRIVRETEAPLPELPYSLDHFSAAGNPIETLGYYPDLGSGRAVFDAAVRLSAAASAVLTQPGARPTNPATPLRRQAEYVSLSQPRANSRGGVS